ncbi:unnamed protein product [Ambrosiozyma monospora]|uniref:Unnamed protein product n=1 Tax=Ambrosiozyma monospora TaxID=43982 RepID=A0A9W6YZA9_AMBMO|nr:unnamed protein product [Ambrosiozyma monospora]
MPQIFYELQQVSLLCSSDYNVVECCSNCGNVIKAVSSYVTDDVFDLSCLYETTPTGSVTFTASSCIASSSKVSSSAPIPSSAVSSSFPTSSDAFFNASSSSITAYSGAKAFDLSATVAIPSVLSLSHSSSAQSHLLQLLQVLHVLHHPVVLLLVLHLVLHLPRILLASFWLYPCEGSGSYKESTESYSTTNCVSASSSDVVTSNVVKAAYVVHKGSTVINTVIYTITSCTDNNCTTVPTSGVEFDSV